jgi:Magnesium chelatase, subunit ChlI
MDSTPVRLSLRPEVRLLLHAPQVEKYLSRISDPLLDRIDLYVEVPSVPFTQLAEMPPARPRPTCGVRCCRPEHASPSGSAPGALKSTGG